MTDQPRDTPQNRDTLFHMLYPRKSSRLAGTAAAKKRKDTRSSQYPGSGGRHFAMRAASFQRSRIAAILNSLYPIAV
jgi:hypothetical protein